MKFISTHCQVFPILLCNQSCSYCINSESSDANLAFKVSDGDKWIKALNNLGNVQTIGICGGEPGLHPDLPRIINSLKERKSICLGTNASRRVMPNLKMIEPKPWVTIQPTYHPTEVNLDEFIENITELRNCGLHVGANMVVGPHNRDEFKEVAPIFKEAGFRLVDLMYKGYVPGTKTYFPESQLERSGQLHRKKAICHFDFPTPVAPNGDVYACHYFMYSQTKKGIIGNIFDEWMTYPKTMHCSDYGYCNGCETARTIEPLE